MSRLEVAPNHLTPSSSEAPTCLGPRPTSSTRLCSDFTVQWSKAHHVQSLLRHTFPMLFTWTYFQVSPRQFLPGKAPFPPNSGFGICHRRPAHVPNTTRVQYPTGVSLGTNKAALWQKTAAAEGGQRTCTASGETALEGYMACNSAFAQDCPWEPSKRLYNGLHTSTTAPSTDTLANKKTSAPTTAPGASAVACTQGAPHHPPHQCREEEFAKQQERGRACMRATARPAPV